MENLGYPSNKIVARYLCVAFLHLFEQVEELGEGRAEVGLELLGVELEVVDDDLEGLGRRDPHHDVLLRGQDRQQNLDREGTRINRECFHFPFMNVASLFLTSSDQHVRCSTNEFNFINSHSLVHTFNWNHYKWANVHE